MTSPSRLRTALLLALLVVSGVACQRSPTASPSAARAAEPELVPVPEPDLTGAEPAVRQQIEEARARLAGERGGDRADAGRLAEAYADLGRIYIAYEFLDAADACFVDAESLAKNDYRWPYLRGYLYKMQGRLDDATAPLERSLELAPNNVPALLRLADLRIDLGQPDEARPLFEKALELDPRSAAALEGLGKLAVAAGDDAAAVRYFERALALQPNASSLHYALAQADRRLGKTAEAKRHLELRGDVAVAVRDPLLEPIVSLGRSSQFYLVQAGQAMQNHRYDAAVDAYLKALEQDPKSFLARRGASVAMLQIGDPEGAAQQLTEALATATTGDPAKDAQEKAEVLRLLGELRASEGRDDQALERFREALRRDPSRHDIRLELADTLARTGALDQARRQYDAVLADDPGNASALVKRATVWINLHDEQAALADFRRAVAARPDDADIRLHFADALEFLGKNREAEAEREAARKSATEPSQRSRIVAREAQDRARRGDAEGAVRLLRQAIDIDPDSVPARYGLAAMLGQMGRLDEAHAAFREVLSREPRNGDAWYGDITVLLLLDRWDDAKLALRDALRVFPRDDTLADALARLLATAPDATTRNGTLALELARRVHAARDDPSTRETLASAYAETGDFDAALELARGLVGEASKEAASPRAERWAAESQSYAAARAWRASSPREIVEILRGSPPS